MRDDPGTSESDDGSAKWRRRAVVACAIIGIVGVFLLAVRGLGGDGDPHGRPYEIIQTTSAVNTATTTVPHFSRFIMR